VVEAENTRKKIRKNQCGRGFRRQRGATSRGGKANSKRDLTEIQRGSCGGEDCYQEISVGSGTQAEKRSRPGGGVGGGGGRATRNQNLGKKNEETASWGD